MIDRELQRHVEDALAFEPSVDAADIGVSVANGIVTLRGDVPTFTAKTVAERVALHVYGVKAVANDINVILPGAHERTDAEIAQAAVTALQWSTIVPANKVSVAVSKGWISLTGTLEWHYQRAAAARCLRDLKGVRGVNNDITVRSNVKVGDIRDKIEAAFKRSAEIDARRIVVGAQDDGKVTLTGNVHSWAERQEAERAAWAAPGVTHVDDRLSITP